MRVCACRHAGCGVRGSEPRHGNLQGSVGFDDVDGGKTTLLSPFFDLSDETEALVTYWRWYTNNVGDNPGTDRWIVEISSNNGLDWEVLENMGLRRIHSHNRKRHGI